MPPTNPPKIPMWLLIHFGSSPNNAELLGDLAERYGQGRSPLWYWRQAAAAIVVSFFKEIWSHKLLTVRAILVGWGVFFAVSRFSFYLTWQLLFSLASWSRYWRHTSITIGVQISELLLWGILTGWLVARFHRRSQKAMVLAYAVFWAALWAERILPDLLRGRGGPAFSALIWIPVLIVITPISILVGGGVFGPRNDDDSARNRAAVS